MSVKKLYYVIKSGDKRVYRTTKFSSDVIVLDNETGERLYKNQILEQLRGILNVGQKIYCAVRGAKSSKRVNFYAIHENELYTIDSRIAFLSSFKVHNDGGIICFSGGDNGIYEVVTTLSNLLYPSDSCAFNMIRL